MAQQPISIQIAGHTDRGMRRKLNQDHIGFDQALGIAVLADGMGGHQSGEIASRMAVRTVLQHLQQLANPPETAAISPGQVREQLGEAVCRSNSEIYRAGQLLQGRYDAISRTGHSRTETWRAARVLRERQGMGTTIVAALVRERQLFVGHVGDSRLYRYRNRDLTQITRDHSLLQDLVDRGTYTRDQARQANVGHIVTRALGTREKVEVDTLQQQLEPEDLLLLCSDGLSDMVGDWEIAEVLKNNRGELINTVRALVDTANRNGGKDNISVILLQAGNPDDAEVA